jgi:putative ABC transport system substrate-binding protein
LETLKHADADALFPASDSTVQSHIALVIDAARSRKVPAIFNEGSLVAEGGLASYGVSYYAMAQLASKYVRKVLEGTRPSDLPVERSERFELVLNARTAREIGITFPSSLLLRADQVIQ